jgi:subtilisin family serine protease
MKLKYVYASMFFLFAGGLFFIGCVKDENTKEETTAVVQHNDPISFKSEPITGQYIVVLNDLGPRAEVSPGNYEEMLLQVLNASKDLVAKEGIDPSKVIRSYTSSIVGFVITNITESEAQRLEKNPSVEFVEQDQTINLMGGPPGGGGGSCATNTSETIPCGITAVNGGSNYTGTRKAYVLDTGIDLTHSDLNVASYGFNGTTESGLNDGNGHGTHVAGTIAAIGGNGRGVVGVAAGALVVPVKVLNRRGSGTNSGVIAGVDYVGANGNAGDVANMSLGGGASTALDNAVLNASSGGVWFVIAAGNDSANANNYSPARVNGTYVRTIASMTCSGAWSSFSNFGMPPVDWIAPGSSVCSTYNGGGYASLSGTSMATPHAAGVILLRGANPNSCGTVSHSSGTYTRICN